MTKPFEKWCWPMFSWAVDLDGDGPIPPVLRSPVVSSGFGPRERNVYSGGVHLGVDITYPWRPGDPERGPLAVTRVGGKGRFGFVMPSNALVCAAGPGEVILSKGPNSRGQWSAVIDHGNTVLTWHQHLRAPNSNGSIRVGGAWSIGVVRVGSIVAAGDPIGVAGWDTADQKANGGREQFHHLHWGWLFRSSTYDVPAKVYDLGRTLGLGFRAVALDPERFLRDLAVRPAPAGWVPNWETAL